jgi:uncharacterized protein YecE (DUF72 family)
MVYVRLHGPDHDHLYAGSYGDADLYWWADRILEWHRQHLGVFAYFNNDGYGRIRPDRVPVSEGRVADSDTTSAGG